MLLLAWLKTNRSPMTIAPSFAEIDVSGPDARAFLHGQFASDVQAVDIGEWRYSCYCLADGRVQALMMLARTADCEMRLLLPADLASTVAERLQRFRLRARCTITVHPVAIIAPTATAAPDAVHYHCDAFSWMSVPAQEACALSADRWTQQLALGIPWIVAATSASFLPQMLALERLRALSLRKGCFPGQEVVARTHFLGRVKRRLVTLSVNGSDTHCAPGSALVTLDAGDSAGTLLAIADNGIALAVVNEASIPASHLRAEAGAQCATLVIDRDVNETISDALLNGRCTPHSAHGVSTPKMV